jgi:PAS domain S-box-containing protein
MISFGLQESWVDISLVPLKNEAGKTTSVLGIARDITKRRQAEAALRESEVRFRTMADWTDDWEYWIDPTRKFVYISPSVERITGYSSEEFMADPDLIDRIVHPDDRRVWEEHVPLHLTTTKETSPSEIEFRLIHKDGSVRWIGHICRSIFLDDGTCIGRRVSNRDITERRRAEEEIQLLNATLEQRVLQRTAQLSSSLEDKIILLREVHHRVKNNLQIIISLLNLQSRQFTDPQVQNAIREIQLRVNAISMVHERLFINEEIETIDLGSYFRSLATTLFSFYNVSQERVHMQVGIDNLTTDIDNAVPLGLIVNELISNSLLHAFPYGKTGTISITGTDSGGMLEIRVFDNGIGLPPAVDTGGDTTLGFRLVHMLTEQINGTLAINRTAGTQITLTFPKPAETTGKKVR